MIQRLGARVIAAIIAVPLLLALIGGAFHYWQKSRSQGAQIRVDSGQKGALENSAADAVNTTQGVGRDASQSEELTRTNERDIRNAPGANDKVNPAVRDAGLRGLCRRPAYRDSERCRLLQAAPR